MYIFVPLVVAAAFAMLYVFFETIAYRELISAGRKYRQPKNGSGRSNVLGVVQDYISTWIKTLSINEISKIDETKLADLATQEFMRFEKKMMPYYRLKRLGQFCVAMCVISILVFIVMAMAQGMR